MKKTIISIMLASLAIGPFVKANDHFVKHPTSTALIPENQKDQVTVVIQNYFAALNASNAEKVVSLFTSNGVLLAPGAPTAAGAEQIKGTFQYVFDNFKYNLSVAIDGVEISGDFAYVSSTSKGSFVIKASNETVQDDFRETFILKKEAGQWKIARYMYNKSK